MSFTSIFAIGASSLTAFAKGIEAISGNVANTDTTGYKRVRTDFAALLPTSSSANGLVSAGAAGTGVAAAPRQLFSEQGAIARGNQSTHVAVAGDGYFVVSRQPGASTPGDLLYTRAGDFKPDSEGNLVNAAGFYLQGTTSAGGGGQGLQSINVNRLPAGADPATLGALVSVAITTDGAINATYANGSNFTISRIPLALFVNEDGLELADRTAVRATALSGEAEIAAAGTGRAGSIEGSALESSTVDIGAEFSALIETQRAYSTGARILSTADELWRTLVSTAA